MPWNWTRFVAPWNFCCRRISQAVCGEREEADLVNVKVKSVPHKMVIKVPQIDLDRRVDEQVERLLGKWNLRSGANAPPPGALKFYGQS